MSYAEQIKDHRGERERLRATLRQVEDGSLNAMFKPMGGLVESRSWEYRRHLEGVIGDLDNAISRLEVELNKD